MKRILIDISHLPQFNFFKNAILAFHPDELDIYCVKRGKLLEVMQHELPGYQIRCIGDYKHNKGRCSLVLKVVIPRILRLFKEIKPSRHKLILTAHYQANLVARSKGIPNIAFIDDPKRLTFSFLRFSANELFLPLFRRTYQGTKCFNALKEWAYLSPSYFEPNKVVLEAYGLQPKQYVFMREVSTKTSNYLSQDEDIILSISKKWPSNVKVVLSLEIKDNAHRYPEDWTILEEPVNDVHSLMYFSQVVVSSGDSMAREGAMLGVPSIYVGNRDMPANEVLMRQNILWKTEPREMISVVQDMISGACATREQELVRNSLYRDWDDMTELILDEAKRWCGSEANELRPTIRKANRPIT